MFDWLTSWHNDWLAKANLTNSSLLLLWFFGQNSDKTMILNGTISKMSLCHSSRPTSSASVSVVLFITSFMSGITTPCLISCGLHIFRSCSGRLIFEKQLSNFFQQVLSGTQIDTASTSLRIFYAFSYDDCISRYHISSAMKMCAYTCIWTLIKRSLGTHQKCSGSGIDFYYGDGIAIRSQGKIAYEIAQWTSSVGITVQFFGGDYSQTNCVSCCLLGCWCWVWLSWRGTSIHQRCWAAQLSMSVTSSCSLLSGMEHRRRRKRSWLSRSKRLHESDGDCLADISMLYASMDQENSKLEL